MNVKETKIKWESLVPTWDSAGPPATPSDDDIKIYSKFICSAMNENQSGNILLLGCTPRIRKLISKLNLTVTCVDISEDMLLNTTSFLSDLEKNESYVCQDWLKMNLGCQYSCIIGDKVLDNVPYKNWNKFKERLLSHLLPGGSLIIRIAPQDYSLLGCSFMFLLKKWTKQFENGQVSLENAASSLWEQALGASAKSTPGIQSIALFNDEITELSNTLECLPEVMATVFCEFKKLFEKSIEYKWTSYCYEDVIDKFNDEFELVSFEHANDYEVSYRQPILHFKKNNNSR